MSLAIGPVAAVAISTVVVLICRRLQSGRYTAAAAFVLAFCAGYVLLPSWARLVPERHWHWLPYLACGAMVLGPVALAEGIFAAERWLLLAMLAGVAACLLVPGWSTLRPPRSVYVPCLAAGFLLLTVLLDPLPARLPGRSFIPLLAVSAICLAAVIAAEVSVTYACVAGVAAASLVGCCLVSCMANSFPDYTVVARGLVPAFAVTVGGAAFVGSIEPQPPLLPLLVIPAAPLALWVCTGRRIHRLHAAAAAAIQTAVVLVPLIIAVVWLL